MISSEKTRWLLKKRSIISFVVFKHAFLFTVEWGLLLRRSKKVCTGPEMVPKAISGALSTSLLCLPEGLGSLLFFLPVLPHLVLPCMENFETQREMSTLRV